MPRRRSSSTTAEWVVRLKRCSSRRIDRSRNSCTSRSSREYFMSRCSDQNIAMMLNRNIPAMQAM